MAEIDYSRYLVNRPETCRMQSRALNRTSPPLVYMSSAQVPEASYHVEFGWVWGMPEPATFLREQVHNYDEVMLNIGCDYRDPEDLGGEIEYILGGQTLRINSTGAVFIPRGIKHGPLTYKSFHKPHVRVFILLGTGVREEKPEGDIHVQTPAGFNAGNYVVRKPAYEVLAQTPVKNRQGPSSMTFISNHLIPGSNIYIEGGWVFGMPDPNPHIFEHVHDYEELVLHFGTDPNRPEELGAEIEFSVGGQPLKLDKTCLVFVPRSVKHGPLIWKKYTAPHLEMAIMPGAGTLDQADPGGHREKMQRSKKNG